MVGYDQVHSFDPDKEFYKMLSKAMEAPGGLGDTAKAVARLMHPHFLTEEEYALPPLRLLRDLAETKVVPDANEILAYISHLSRMKNGSAVSMIHG